MHRDTFNYTNNKGRGALQARVSRVALGIHLIVLQRSCCPSSWRQATHEGRSLRYMLRILANMIDSIRTSISHWTSLGVRHLTIQAPFWSTPHALTNILSGLTTCTTSWATGPSCHWIL